MNGMKNIKINRNGINVGELKQYLESLPNDMLISDTIVMNQTTYSTVISEMYTVNNELVLISQLTREILEK